MRFRETKSTAPSGLCQKKNQYPKILASSVAKQKQPKSREAHQCGENGIPVIVHISQCTGVKIETTVLLPAGGTAAMALPAL